MYRVEVVRDAGHRNKYAYTYVVRDDSIVYAQYFYITPAMDACETLNIARGYPGLASIGVDMAVKGTAAPAGTYCGGTAEYWCGRYNDSADKVSKITTSIRQYFGAIRERDKVVEQLRSIVPL